MENTAGIKHLVEATADFEKQLTGKVFNLFPFIDSNNLQSFRQEESSRHISFSLQETDPAVVKEVLSIGCKRASVKDTPEFSAHGAKHKVYEEALKKVEKVKEKPPLKYKL